MNSTVLATLIGLPSSFIIAIGTVWAAAHRGGPGAAVASGPVPVPTPEPVLLNGQRHVTQTELKEMARDMREEMRAVERRQSEKFDLIVELLRNGRR